MKSPKRKRIHAKCLLAAKHSTFHTGPLPGSPRRDEVRLPGAARPCSRPGPPEACAEQKLSRECVFNKANAKGTRVYSRRRGLSKPPASRPGPGRRTLPPSAARDLGQPLSWGPSPRNSEASAPSTQPRAEESRRPAGRGERSGTRTCACARCLGEKAPCCLEKVGSPRVSMPPSSLPHSLLPPPPTSWALNPHSF